VVAIRDLGDEWGVEFPGRFSHLNHPAPLHSAVLLAIPAHRLGHIEFHAQDARTNALAPLAQIIHPPIASVVLGFRRNDVRHPLTGFGFLVPESEKRRILGAIFSSSIFAGRAPSGHVTITAYLGGCRAPELALAPATQVIANACAELRDILGITGSPTFQHCTVVPHAIPQYNLGYDRFKQTMEQLETNHHGLFFAGTCKDGISLGNSIISGHDVARRIRACISRKTLQVPQPV